jgi:hypothetical protein
MTAAKGFSSRVDWLNGPGHKVGVDVASGGVVSSGH